MPCDTRVTSFAVRAPTSMMAGPDVVGAERFEPSNAGAKVPCLTTWPRPTMRDSTPRTPSGGGRPLWRMLRCPVRPPYHPSAPPPEQNQEGGRPTRELLLQARPNEPTQTDSLYVPTAAGKSGLQAWGGAGYAT